MTTDNVSAQEQYEAVREANHKYYLDNRDKMLTRNHNYYRATKEQRKIWNDTYAQKRKVRVLSHYGNGRLTCVICREDRIDCLSIDHINGRGTQHRLQDKLYGYKMYQWLIKQEFPMGYQTLCMNCQFIKRKQEMKQLRHKSSEVKHG